MFCEYMAIVILAGTVMWGTVTMVSRLMTDVK